MTFSSTGANFTGSGYIELPDNDDFSVATKGGLTVLVDLTISDWHGKGASEYVHWMGKGTSGAHEWTFRHYVQGGHGEASSRQGRVSFYHFNPAGGLGAGSYFQDSMDNSEHVIEATGDMKQVQMNKDGVLRDTDALSGYSVVPKNTKSRSGSGRAVTTPGSWSENPPRGVLQPGAHPRRDLAAGLGRSPVTADASPADRPPPAVRAAPPPGCAGGVMPPPRPRHGAAGASGGRGPDRQRGAAGEADLVVGGHAQAARPRRGTSPVNVRWRVVTVRTDPRQPPRRVE